MTSEREAEWQDGVDGRAPYRWVKPFQAEHVTAAYLNAQSSSLADALEALRAIGCEYAIDCATLKAKYKAGHEACKVCDAIAQIESRLASEPKAQQETP